MLRNNILMLQTRLVHGCYRERRSMATDNPEGVTPFQLTGTRRTFRSHPRSEKRITRARLVNYNHIGLLPATFLKVMGDVAVVLIDPKLRVVVFILLVGGSSFLSNAALMAPATRPRVQQPRGRETRTRRVVRTPGQTVPNRLGRAMPLVVRSSILKGS